MAQAEEKMVLANGKEQILQKSLIAKPWRWGDITEWERKQAVDHFGENIRGLTMGENPVHRLSCFDSQWAQEVNGWTDDERVIVETAVRNGPGHGPDYVVIETPRVPAPWPTYPSLTGKGVVERIVETIKTIGVDVDHVLAFERENMNRHSVIEALEALKNAAPESDELVEA